ncbi:MULTISPECIES: type I-C CRISPR-associated protein Cas8c/Csd1 [Actinosynnema]|uniref:type I-C CRISPR-associated protein Cas8c/Csd1 n=1 Tax=Actinosynnema TaxID=40566 RepID=UPI0020A30F44|nr:type I-C CRISPR-associated protein Cas8c/Csd1 [Actinosynnema pretiosum]MCP2097351.1 hypothetical protein [Actinosynnema pretiosum]
MSEQGDATGRSGVPLPEGWYDEPAETRAMYEGIDDDEAAEIERVLRGRNPVEIALNDVGSVLLGRIVDPVERYRAAARVADGLPATLEKVRALSVMQLLHDSDPRLSVAQAAERLGITRQRAYVLLNDNGYDSPRQAGRDPDRFQDDPGYRLGVFLGVADALAAALDPGRRKWIDTEIDKLTTNVYVRPRSVFASVSAALQRHLNRQRSTDKTLDLCKELEHATADVGELPTTLTPEQQMRLLIMRSQTRARLTSRRGPASAPTPAEQAKAQALFAAAGVDAEMAEAITTVLDLLALELNTNGGGVMGQSTVNILNALKWLIAAPDDDYPRSDTDSRAAQMARIIREDLPGMPVGNKLKTHPAGEAVLRLREIARRRQVPPEHGTA